MQRRVLVPATLLLATLGCASATGITPVPKSEDVKMGRSYAAEIDKQLPVETDPAINAGIRAIGRRIVEANGIKDYEFDFHVVRDDGTVNAFALPGGKIYVYSGLIARADDEAEVAGVLAHEIGHVVERHSTKRILDQLGIQTVEQVFLGKSGMIAQTAASLVTKFGFLSYSRHQESDADRVGLALLQKTDYDPQGMVRFFEKIEKLQKGGSSAVTRFLSDHPDPAERIKSVEKGIKALPPEKQTGQTYAGRWTAYRDLVCPHGPSAKPQIGPAQAPPRPGEPRPEPSAPPAAPAPTSPTRGRTS